MGKKSRLSRLLRWVSGRKSAHLNALIYRASDERDETIRELELYQKKSNDSELGRQELQQRYRDLEKSFEATNAQIARGQLGAYASKIKELKAQIQNYQQSEREIGGRYGEEQSKRIKLGKELEGIREEYAHTEALLENSWRILDKRERLIGFLRRTVHEKEEKVVENYLNPIIDFFHRNPGEYVKIGPGLEGTIIEASPEAKEILHYNGDLVGKRYLDLLDLDEDEKRRALVVFSQFGEQKKVVPIIYGGGKKDLVRIAWFPVTNQEPGLEKKHLFTVSTVSSVGWLERRLWINKDEDLKYQLKSEEEQRREERILREKAQRLIAETQKELNSGSGETSL